MSQQVLAVRLRSESLDDAALNYRSVVERDPCGVVVQTGALICVNPRR